MRKPRRLKNIDNELSGILDLEGLVVVGGDEDNLEVKSIDTEIPLCEKCMQRKKLGIIPRYGCCMKNRGSYRKKYYDVIRKADGNYKVVTLHYIFYKYQCKDDRCSAIYQKPVDFARDNAHVTKRFEDYVVGLASIMSYANVSRRLTIISMTNEGNTQLTPTASKQAVADIIKRWTVTKDLERGQFFTPELLGMMKFASDGKEYVLAFDAGDKEIRVLEVLPSVDRMTMEAFLRKLNATSIKGVVTDCEPLIVEACENVLPGVEIMVDIDSILEQAIVDFDSLIRKDAIHITVYNKKLLKKNPDEVAGSTYDVQEIRTVTKKYPRVSLGYDHLSRLRAILSRDWDAVDIREWNENTPDEIKTFFQTSSLYVSEYWEKMLRYYMRRNEVSGELYKRLLELNGRIQAFKYYSGELFKSRILYIPDAYNESDVRDAKWHGVPYKSIITAMDDMQHGKEDSINEHIRKGF